MRPKSPKTAQPSKAPKPPKPLKLVAPRITEAEIQAGLMRRLRLRGWLVVRINSGGGRDRNGQLVRSYIVQGLNVIEGFPDVLALKGELVRGGDGSGGERRVVARLFEVKALGGELRPAQERFATFAGLFKIKVEVVEGWEAMQALKL